MMEENNAQKQNKLQQFYSHVRTSFFNIMFELLKDKQTGKDKITKFSDLKIF
jgi:hypothetical protein